MGMLRTVACVVALAPAIALAQPKSSEVQRAGELVKQAIAKSQAGDHDGAIGLYQKAFGLVPQPMLLSNIGSEYQQAGKPEDALKYFCRYLEADPAGVNATYATAQAKSLQIQLGHAVDDRDVCKVATTRPRHEPPPPPPPPARPPEPAPPEPEVTATTAPVTEPPHASRNLEYAGYGIVGAGAVIFAIGSYYGVEAKRISDSISNHDPMKPWEHNILDIEAEGQSDENKQIGFMVAGGILMAGGAVVAILGHNRAAEHVAIAPTATPSSIGLAISGGF